jgi:LysM repeat protein
VEGRERDAGSVMRTSADSRACLGQRPGLLRGLAAGGVVVLAACSAPGRDNAKSIRSKTTAPETTAAPTTTTSPSISYQVKRGDTLTAIAKLFGVSKAAISAANQLGSEDRLTEGQILQIPPSPPAQLIVTPPDGIAGHVFTFMLNGAKAGEVVTFEIVTPGGEIFTGSPHTAGENGVVTASYRSGGDAAGTYTVVATGDRGTSLQATYHLLG